MITKIMERSGNRSNVYVVMKDFCKVVYFSRTFSHVSYDYNLGYLYML